MQTFAERMFFAFGLRRNTATRRTPEGLQIERSQVNRNPPPRGARPMLVLTPPPKPAPLRICIELRDGGLLYVKPLAAQPRTA